MTYFASVHIIIFILLLAIPGISQGQQFSGGPEKTTLIELFTSEGCSSCPPADRWMSGLKSDQDLWNGFVPVAYHVDYWDWIGWKDEFARQVFGERQKAYKRQGKASSVYTPGFFVNGQEWRGYFRQRDSTRPPRSVGQAGRLTADLTASGMDITYTGQPDESIQGALTAHVALLDFDRSNLVKWGENIGKRLHHDFVVIHLITLDLAPSGTAQNRRHTGSESFNSEARKWLGQPGTKAVATWVTNPDTLEVYQATGGWLNSPTNSHHRPK